MGTDGEESSSRGRSLTAGGTQGYIPASSLSPGEGSSVTSEVAIKEPSAQPGQEEIKVLRKLDRKGEAEDLSTHKHTLRHTTRS